MYGAVDPFFGLLLFVGTLCILFVLAVGYVTAVTAKGCEGGALTAGQAEAEGHAFLHRFLYDGQ